MESGEKRGGNMTERPRVVEGCGSKAVCDSRLKATATLKTFK